MTLFEVLSTGIGVAQCYLIHVGLKRMGQASDDRKSQHEETMTLLQNQHATSMQALEELIKRTSRRRA